MMILRHTYLLVMTRNTCVSIWRVILSHAQMWSQLYLHKMVHAYSFTLSLIVSTIMGFNLLEFLRSLTMVVPS